MNKMKKLIQSEKHPKLIIFNSVFKRIATVAVLMAVCISALFATNSITADREPEFYFYIGDDPKNDGMTMLRFYESVADLAPNEILDYYTPDYIPRGYKIHQVHTGSCVRIDYTNEADDLIVEGRLSAFFVDADYRIWLMTPDDIRAERISYREDKSIDTVIREIKERTASEKKRYQEIHNIDIDNFEIYDRLN